MGGLEKLRLIARLMLKEFEILAVERIRKPSDFEKGPKKKKRLAKRVVEER